MDNANAHIIEFSSEPTEIFSIASDFTKLEEKRTLVKGESHMHNQEQQLQDDYYKKLSEVIQHYNEVVLFGPTHAKAELFNILKEDHRFDSIKIDMKQTDKMSSEQQLTYVKNCFSEN